MERLRLRCSGDCDCVIQRGPVGDRGGFSRIVPCARQELVGKEQFERYVITHVSETNMCCVSLLNWKKRNKKTFFFPQNGVETNVLHLQDGCVLLESDVAEVCPLLVDSLPHLENLMVHRRRPRRDDPDRLPPIDPHQVVVMSLVETPQQRQERIFAYKTLKRSCRILQRAAWPSTTYWCCSTWPYMRDDPVDVAYNKMRMEALLGNWLTNDVIRCVTFCTQG